MLLQRQTNWTRTKWMYNLPVEFVGPSCAGRDWGGSETPKWASKTARRLEMNSKAYWMKLFNEFAPDLHDLAKDKELFWEEGSVPGPPGHYLNGAYDKEHARYKELFKYSRSPCVLAPLNFMPERHSTIVDGHEIQAGMHEGGRVCHVFIGAFVERRRRSAQPCLPNTHMHHCALLAPVLR